MSNFLRLMLIAAGLLAIGACAAPRPVDDGEGVGSTASGGFTATNAVYELALGNWLNHPEEDLVAAWGVPERSQRLTDGGQALEYRRNDPTGRQLCTTLFTSDVYGMIRTWAYRGINCRAPQLGDYSRAS